MLDSNLISYDIKISLKSPFCHTKLYNFVNKDAALLWTSKRFP